MGVRNIYERFLWFEALVKAGKYPNASRLARQFEISQRTAQRDIEFMRDRLKCPLKYDVAAKGYFYEDGTFSLPLIQLSTEELSALLMARKFLLDISDGALGREISSILDRMASILRKRIALPQDMDDAVSFRMTQRTPTPESNVRTVLEACIRTRRISFGYWSPLSNNTTTRTVDPYHLLNYMGTWQLIAFCHLRQDFRHFNLMVGKMGTATVICKVQAHVGQPAFLWGSRIAPVRSIPPHAHTAPAYDLTSRVLLDYSEGTKGSKALIKPGISFVTISHTLIRSSRK